MAVLVAGLQIEGPVDGIALARAHKPGKGYLMRGMVAYGRKELMQILPERFGA